MINRPYKYICPICKKEFPAWYWGVTGKAGGAGTFVSPAWQKLTSKDIKKHVRKGETVTNKDKAIIEARNLLETDFVILDTETTGIGPTDEAVSIAVIDKNGDTLLNTLLQHHKKSHPKALSTHGISWGETRIAPAWTEVLHQLIEIVAEKTLLIYNAEYDIRILHQMAHRYQIDTHLNVSAIFCVMKVFAPFYGDWNNYHQSYRWQSLSSAASHFDINTSDAHGALADCLMTLGVLKGMALTPTNEEVQNMAQIKADLP